MKARVRIKALGYGGSFVGEVAPDGPAADERRGKKVFVRNVAPGEIVDVTITKDEPKFMLGDAAAIVTPSPDRVSPRCPAFTVCGGCDLQHLSITAQRQAKLDMVSTMIAVQGKLTPQSGVELLGGDLPAFEYRRRVQLHVSRGGEVGFYRSGSSAVVGIQRCDLAMAPINHQLERIRPQGRALAPVIGGLTIECRGAETFVVALVRDEINPRKDFERIEAAGALLAPLCQNVSVRHRSAVLVRLRDGRPIDGGGESDAAGHFSQVNPAANELLVRTVLQHVTAAEVTDLYAGAGNFALPLALAGKKVTAVELDPALVLWGSKLAREAGVNITYVPLPCESFAERHPFAEAVVLDPPRAGARDVAPRFDPTVTKEILYVSCHLPSLTRDLRIAVERGYRFEKLYVVDMFPQTHHVETIAVLSSR